MSETQYAHSLHHILFPSADLDRTAEWYGRVFGLKRLDVSKFTPNTRPVLLTRGNFDLHFTPVQDVINHPHHFAIEVEDWDEFIAHLEEIGVPYEKIRERPQNNSKTTALVDPDGHRVEIVFHVDRTW